MSAQNELLSAAEKKAVTAIQMILSTFHVDPKFLEMLRHEFPSPRQQLLILAFATAESERIRQKPVIQ